MPRALVVLNNSAKFSLSTLRTTSTPCRQAPATSLAEAVTQRLQLCMSLCPPPRPLRGGTLDAKPSASKFSGLRPRGFLSPHLHSAFCLCPGLGCKMFEPSSGRSFFFFGASSAQDGSESSPAPTAQAKPRRDCTGFWCVSVIKKAGRLTQVRTCLVQLLQRLWSALQLFEQMTESSQHMLHLPSTITC